MPTNQEIELEFYDKFFFSQNLEPYPVQEKAFGHVFAGESVLVTVPTGTGKTMMGKAALMRALRSGKTAIYTTPLRALTEEKYREFCDDFGTDKVGFATGDYKVNPDAPIQVLVAEILWNRIYSDQVKQPADVVVMDEGHYFNDPERGYVWEQSLIGLHPAVQLVILSATIGFPESFCQWVYLIRKVELKLVRSDDRKVPLYHEFRDEYLIETVKNLFNKGEVPALIFSFGRYLCFERARLLKSCPRFVTKEEQAEIEARLEKVLLPGGLGPELKSLLTHGIGVHHAGVLPAYRRLVEELTADRLLKFVVTTETIAAGINLPAKRVVFPSLKKVIKKKARLLFPAEYHQMSGRAGRPQFDTEGIAITLGPEEAIQEARKELKDAKKGRAAVTLDEAKVYKKYYTKAKQEAKVRQDVSWDADDHKKLVEGQPAQLQSRTKITAEQILAIGLPDLTAEVLPGQKILEVEAQKAALAAQAAEAAAAEAAAERPPTPALEPLAGKLELVEDEPTQRRLDIRTVIDHLLVPPHERWEAHKRLAMITANLRALGILNEQGRQIDGWIVGKIRGLDGPFIWYCLDKVEEWDAARATMLVELLVDHDVIHNELDKKNKELRRQWILARLRERRRENALITFEDVEQEYWQEHPPILSELEVIHNEFQGKVPHPELHGGKTQKNVWAQMEEAQETFLDFVNRHELAYEEGSLFTYMARVMKAARLIHEVTEIPAFAELELKIRTKLAVIDERILEGLW